MDFSNIYAPVYKRRSSKSIQIKFYTQIFIGTSRSLPVTPIGASRQTAARAIEADGLAALTVTACGSRRATASKPRRILAPSICNPFAFTSHGGARCAKLVIANRLVAIDQWPICATAVHRLLNINHGGDPSA